MPPNNANRNRTLVAFYLVVFWFALAVTSYNGWPNPYSLGLLDTAAVFALLSGAFLALNYWINSRALAPVYLLFGAFVGFITVTNWYYFDYFQSLYTYEILALGMDMQEGTRALTLQPYAFQILLLLTLLIGTGVQVFRLGFRTKAPGLAVGISLIVSGSVGIWSVENSIHAYQKRGAPLLHPANLHPLHALFVTSSGAHTLSKAKGDELQKFIRLNEQHFRAKTEPDSTVKQHNVLILLLESFRADLTGHYTDGKSRLTPNYDAIASDGLTVETYYSNTTHTISAELSLWCSVFDSAYQEKIAYRPEINRSAPCLPTVLKQYGYESYYFHGNKSKFYNRDVLIPALGFDYGYFHQDTPDPRAIGTRVGWGIDDESMLLIALEQLENRDQSQPFFAHLTTLSNHYPFHWAFPTGDESLPYPDTDKGDVWLNYKNAVFYTDYALGQFWQRFKNSPLSENTIVVITSDHGIWRYEPGTNAQLVEKNERFYRAPLTIVTPTKERASIKDRLGSHIDVPPTVLDILNIDANNYPFMGKSLMAEKTDDFKGWVIMNKGIDHILRYDDQVCYHTSDDCHTTQQDCRGWLGEIVWETTDKQFDQCADISGNPLSTGAISPHRSRALIDTFKQARIAIEQSTATF